jgi:hypothetical protein
MIAEAVSPLDLVIGCLRRPPLGALRRPTDPRLGIVDQLDPDVGGLIVSQRGTNGLRFVEQPPIARPILGGAGLPDLG